MEFRAEKMASAIAYIASKIPHLTKKKISKLLYFADKQHLLVYGRTITGDEYHALPQGHIPRRGLDMLNQRPSWVSEKAIEALRRYGHLDENDKRTFLLQSAPDMKVFSKSDIRVLDAVISDLGDLTPSQLERLSHREPSWKQTTEMKRVAFELFFEGHPEAQAIKEALLATES